MTFQLSLGLLTFSVKEAKNCLEFAFLFVPKIGSLPFKNTYAMGIICQIEVDSL